MKRCSACDEEKALTEFYKDKRTTDGLKSQCKQCHTAGNMRTRDLNLHRDTNAEYMRRARAKNPEKFRERERYYSKLRVKDVHVLARIKLNTAAQSGVVTRPNECSKCGVICKPDAHHTDYMQPLDVVWLCTKCHGLEHRIAYEIADARLKERSK